MNGKKEADGSAKKLQVPKAATTSLLRGGGEGEAQGCSL